MSGLDRISIILMQVTLLGVIIFLIIIGYDLNKVQREHAIFKTEVCLQLSRDFYKDTKINKSLERLCWKHLLPYGKK